MTKTARVGMAIAGAGLAAVIAAGPASAIGIKPIPNGNVIDFNHGEVQFIANTGLANAFLSLALPDFSNLDTGAPIGSDVQHTFERAAAAPNAGVQVAVFGALHAPANVETLIVD